MRGSTLAFQLYFKTKATVSRYEIEQPISDLKTNYSLRVFYAADREKLVETTASLKPFSQHIISGKPYLRPNWLVCGTWAEKGLDLLSICTRIFTSFLISRKQFFFIKIYSNIPEFYFNHVSFRISAHASRVNVLLAEFQEFAVKMQVRIHHYFHHLYVNLGQQHKLGPI